ncbi:MAG: hypothetical protein K6G91_10005 [Kiritimatiellae bacterium]|nr:hypothetical protein [Kiritimatiellia bacterium]
MTAMIGFAKVFWLEIVSLVRSKTLVMLAVASVAWMFAAPFIAKGDGTAEGAREMFVRYSLGGAFAILLVSLLAAATGSLARERAAKRLQLTMVRPVNHMLVALAKTAALTLSGASVLALCCILMPFAPGVGDGVLGRQCSHVLKPRLPSPRDEARDMYDAYMADPETPAAVKKAKKSVVLRLLENRAVDHYQTIATNDTVTWRFASAGTAAEAKGLAVRIRFTNQFDVRQDVRGELRIGPLSGVVSNITQAVVTVPLSRRAAEAGVAGAADGLSFSNKGSSALMLRPRKDIDLLVPADSFAWNLARAYLELVSILAIAVAFGVFLGASLGRPVALFVAIVTLVVGEISPSVIEQYPDELETSVADRIGLVLTRFAAEVTRPVAALQPLGRLASDECVEPRETARVVLMDFVAVPLALAILAGLVLPRKQDGL